MAFCLYNLSSIINGLVYFDQFSVLSTTHLILIIVGIVVLLAGVWIVSFPPSGGIRIGVGKWDETEDIQVVPFEGSQDVFEDEPLPLISQPDTNAEEVIGLGLVQPLDDIEQQKTYGSLRVSTHSQQSSPFHARNQTVPVVPSHAPYPQPLPENPRVRTHIISPPTSPTSSHRPRATSSTSHSNHPTPRHSFAGYAYPLPPGAAPGTLTGFSIGLSPVSPGFALVPRERSRRRRATGGLGSTEGESTSGTSKLNARGAHVMKRSVSEGDVSSIVSERQLDSDEEAGETERLLSGEEERGREGCPRDAGTSHSPGKGNTRQSKSRWKWLKGVLTIMRR